MLSFLKLAFMRFQILLTIKNEHTVVTGVTLIILVVILLYFFIIPDKKKKKKLEKYLKELKKGDLVILESGIKGRVYEIKDRFLIIETGPKNQEIEVDKNSITEIVQNVND